MENQTYGIFSKEIEEQISKSLDIIISTVAEDNKNRGGKRYFKKRNFCTEMDISFNSLQKWIEKGLPVIQIEGISLIDMRSAEKFLQEHTI